MAWLFIPTVVGIYTQDWKMTGIALGVMSMFMPLQVWVVLKHFALLIQWLYRTVRRWWAKRKAGKVTGGIVLIPDTGIIYPPAEGVRMLTEPHGNVD
jgi:hypothetical protein